MRSKIKCADNQSLPLLNCHHNTEGLSLRGKQLICAVSFLENSQCFVFISLPRTSRTSKFETQTNREDILFLSRELDLYILVQKVRFFCSFIQQVAGTENVEDKTNCPPQLEP